VSLDLLLLMLSAGAAALALWVLARFPQLGPTRVSGALIHLAAALLAGWVAAPLLASTAAAGRPVLGLLAFVLPALTYVFLAMAWLLGAAQWPHGERRDSRTGRGVRP
jgi:hypothetical protein